MVKLYGRHIGAFIICSAIPLIAGAVDVTTSLVGTNETAEFATPDSLGALSSAPVQPVDLDVSTIRGPENATVQVVEFSDFQCPYCAKESASADQLLVQYPGQLKWVFKNFPLSFHRDALLAHEAALAAGEQGKFSEMHDLLFANQDKLKRKDLVRYAKQLDLDMKRFLVALDSGQYRARIERDKAEGAKLGVNGTPTFFINGKMLVGIQPLSAFQNLIEQELRRLKVARITPVEDRSGGISVQGSSDSPVTVAVFSDFQSPLSAQLTTTLKVLLGHYPRELRLIVKHFPLRFHPEAKLAHEAALAAGEQGKFWEMHDLLFQNQDDLRPERLSAHAKALDLDMEKFTQALEARRYQEVVRQDLLDGMNRDVRGVPTFFINGQRLDGLQTVARLQAVVDQALGHQHSGEAKTKISETRLR